MSSPQLGQTVKVHYTGTLEDGTQFDSSAGREPLEFTLGQGQVIPGFEQALEQMTVGETKTINIPADQAYGPHQPELVQKVEREQIPAEIELALGVQLQAQGPDGQVFRLVVVELDETSATLDGNHPLAGKALTFELELVEIAA
ncbi:MAG: peptidylprolyl isomerase [Sedimenticola sp.]|uniref:Peptidyl-prolyl cis-trans isomerase n=1 Tax=Sedimenticola thiotaurini TaxID=1543721 RepID=A0A558DF66_9GAMM|nr:peptidylprolyl isomerase [Sedimenticola sp.]MCW8920824.1 peptidylprolyl isomerase [Sedimenticola sp.]MCW8947702.1 peptidylprolyl isomerase [Sedimenticola sp.]MCW8977128.1 peptidylprolyl isomerase [Sedimenticola sp.]TVT59669.1 MAG: peptidylprolyl isomerase [Sedimenticola thiotaurini]